MSLDDSDSTVAAIPPKAVGYASDLTRPAGPLKPSVEGPGRLSDLLLMLSTLSPWFPVPVVSSVQNPTRNTKRQSQNRNANKPKAKLIFYPLQNCKFLKEQRNAGSRLWSLAE
jgi:hypothetical protein